MKLLLMQKWIDSVLKNYLNKNDPPAEEVAHIKDWLTLSNEKISLRMSYEQAKKKAEAWTKRLTNNTSKNQGQCEKFFTTRGGLELFHLKDNSALSWEGKRMHHCVSSYKNHPGIFSLRKEGESLATIEIDNGRIIQVRGVENKPLPQNIAAEAWEALGFMQLYLPAEEALRLGFCELDAVEVLELMENCVDPKIYPFNEKDYVSIHEPLNVNTNYSFLSEKFLKVFALQGNLKLVERIISHPNFTIDPHSLKYIYSESLSFKRMDVVFTMLKHEKTIRMWNLIIPYFFSAREFTLIERGFRELTFPLKEINFNPLNLAIQSMNLELIKTVAFNRWGSPDVSTQAYLKTANNLEITDFIDKLVQLHHEAPKARGLYFPSKKD